MNTLNYTKELDALKDDLEAVRGDIASLTKAVKGDAANGIDRAASAFAATAAAALEAAKEKEREALQAVSRQVQDSPIQSLLVAVGVGFVVGSLLRR